MKKELYYIVLLFGIIIAVSNPAVAQVPSFTFDHQDPAGDVLKYNATENGTPVADPFYERLDIKWLYSEEDGVGNIMLKMDLKAKTKFINRDDTKYVFRILTTADNTKGYNITYTNQSTTLVPFSTAGNGTPVDISANVTFVQEKGDEMMVITISISKYLRNISYYNPDAYSMMITHNATYLDYISELPGHPEYVNPVVEEGEDLGNGQGSDDEEEDESDSTGVLFGIIFIIAILITLAIVILLWVGRKQRR